MPTRETTASPPPPIKAPQGLPRVSQRRKPPASVVFLASGLRQDPLRHVVLHPRHPPRPIRGVSSAGASSTRLPTVAVAMADRAKPSSSPASFPSPAPSSSSGVTPCATSLSRIAKYSARSPPLLPLLQGPSTIARSAPPYASDQPPRARPSSPSAPPSVSRIESPPLPLLCMHVVTDPVVSELLLPCYRHGHFEPSRFLVCCTPERLAALEHLARSCFCPHPQPHPYVVARSQAPMYVSATAPAACSR